MKGARALASGTLVLVAICAVPAMSAAQDAGTPTDATTSTTPTEPTATTPDAPPSGAPAGGLSPNDGGANDRPDRGSPEAPAAAPAASAATPDTGGAKAHKAASSSVTMVDFAFSPGTITINVGDTVTWRNSGQAPHNATGDGISTGTINPGGSGSHTFNSAGTFSYICTIHPQMKGTIRVVSSSGGGGSGGGSSTSSSGTSESSAVASPDAAGTSTTLPMTGMAVGALALVGAGLLASGLLVRRANEAPRRRWMSLF